MELFKHPEAKEPLQIKKRDISAPDTSTLTERQFTAYNTAMDYIFSKNKLKSFLLVGSAGTGKSYTVAAIIEGALAKSRYLDRPVKLQAKGLHIACTATTNKAVKITYRMAKYYDPAIEYRTIHSLLGLKEQIRSDGSRAFVQDKMNPPKLNDYDVIFVDEVSMLPNELLIGSTNTKGLYDYIAEGLKVIFIGDNAQIPPVNSEPSAIFDEDVRDEMGVGCVQLTEIMRQAEGNPIIALATKIRQKLHLPKKLVGEPTTLYEGDKGVYIVSRTDDSGLEDFSQLIRHIFTSDNYKLDIDYGKIIAYNNSVVDAMNGVVRDDLYGEAADESIILEGERLIVDNPVADIDDSQKIVLPTNEEITVISYDVKGMEIETGHEIKYYDTIVEFTRMDNSKSRTRIRIPHPEGYMVLSEVLEEMAERAKKLAGSLDATIIWQAFYRVKRNFADVSYAYAITAHRSQGSTYTNCIVLEYNIDTCRKVKERQAIKYTSLTRASDRVFVITE